MEPFGAQVLYPLDFVLAVTDITLVKERNASMVAGRQDHVRLVRDLIEARYTVWQHLSGRSPLHGEYIVCAETMFEGRATQ